MAILATLESLLFLSVRDGAFMSITLLGCTYSAGHCWNEASPEEQSFGQVRLVM